MTPIKLVVHCSAEAALMGCGAFHGFQDWVLTDENVESLSADEAETVLHYRSFELFEPLMPTKNGHLDRGESNWSKVHDSIHAVTVDRLERNHAADELAAAVADARDWCAENGDEVLRRLSNDESALFVVAMLGEIARRISGAAGYACSTLRHTGHVSDAKPTDLGAWLTKAIAKTNFPASVGVSLATFAGIGRSQYSGITLSHPACDSVDAVLTRRL